MRIRISYRCDTLLTVFKNVCDRPKSLLFFLLWIRMIRILTIYFNKNNSFSNNMLSEVYMIYLVNKIQTNKKMIEKFKFTRLYEENRCRIGRTAFTVLSKSVSNSKQAIGIHFYWIPVFKVSNRLIFPLLFVWNNSFHVAHDLETFVNTL